MIFVDKWTSALGPSPSTVNFREYSLTAIVSVSFTGVPCVSLNPRHKQRINKVSLINPNNTIAI